jgi:uncharacterized damage-inducible protein DinB
MHHLSNTCLLVLAQLESAVDALQDDQFNRPIPALGQSTIGQHVRHTVEFFTALEHGLLTGRIDYDNRARNRSIETERHVAQSAITAVKQMIAQQNEDKPLVLVVNYELMANNPVALVSSYFRELTYTIEHAIHHMAIIKIGILDLVPQMKLPAEFGVAISTLRHQQKAEMLNY